MKHLLLIFILSAVLIVSFILRETLFNFHYVSKESCFRQNKKVTMYAGDIETWKEGDEILYTCIEEEY